MAEQDIPLHSKQASENTQDLVNILAGRDTRTSKLKNKGYYYNIGNAVEQFLTDDITEQTDEIKEGNRIQKEINETLKTAFGKNGPSIKSQLPDPQGKSGGGIIPENMKSELAEEFKKNEKARKEFDRRDKDDEDSFRKKLLGGLGAGAKATFNMGKELSGDLKEQAEKIETPVALLTEPFRELKAIIGPFVKRTFEFLKSPAKKLFGGIAGLFKSKDESPPISEGDQTITDQVQAVDTTNAEGFKKIDDQLIMSNTLETKNQEMLSDQHRENMRLTKKKTPLGAKKAKGEGFNILDLLKMPFLFLGKLFKTKMGKLGSLILVPFTFLAGALLKSKLLGGLIKFIKGTKFGKIFTKGGLKIFGKGLGKVLGPIGLIITAVTAIVGGMKAMKDTKAIAEFYKIKEKDVTASMKRVAFTAGALSDLTFGLISVEKFILGLLFV